MAMTYQQYIDNPLGKANAVFSQREHYRKFYTEKFDKINLREAGKINYLLYHNEKKDEFYCYIKVPSEIVKDFYYDVVVQFYTKDNANRTENDLRKYNVRFFSNDPSFVFTYLHTFKDHDMFISDLKPKAPKLALTQKAKTRNPLNLVYYCKSLYFAYIIIKRKNLFLKSTYKMYGKPYDTKNMLRLIEDADVKIAKRQELGDKISKTKAREARNTDYAKHTADLNKSAARSEEKGLGTLKVTPRSKTTRRSGIIPRGKKSKG